MITGFQGRLRPRRACPAFPHSPDRGSTRLFTVLCRRGRENLRKAASVASLKLFLKTGRVERRASARADTAGTVVDGLKNSISDFTSNEQIKGASSKDVVDLLLITQYFDMLNAIGTRPDTQTVFIDEDGE